MYTYTIIWFVGPFLIYICNFKFSVALFAMVNLFCKSTNVDYLYINDNIPFKNGEV